MVKSFKRLKQQQEFAGVVAKALLEFAKTGEITKLKRRVHMARINCRQKIPNGILRL